MEFGSGSRCDTCHGTTMAAARPVLLQPLPLRRLVPYQLREHEDRF